MSRSNYAMHTFLTCKTLLQYIAKFFVIRFEKRAQSESPLGLRNAQFRPDAEVALQTKSTFPIPNKTHPFHCRRNVSFDQRDAMESGRQTSVILHRQLQITQTWNKKRAKQDLFEHRKNQSSCIHFSPLSFCYTIRSGPE